MSGNTQKIEIPRAETGSDTSMSYTGSMDSRASLPVVAPVPAQKPTPPTTGEQLANIVVSTVQTATAGGFTAVFSYIASQASKGQILALIGKGIGESAGLQAVFTGVHALSAVGLVATYFTPRPLGSKGVKAAFLLMQTTAVTLYTINHLADPADRNGVIGYAILPLILSMMSTGAVVANRMKMLPTSLKRTAIASVVLFAAHAALFHSVMLHTAKEESPNLLQTIAATGTVAAVAAMNCIKLGFQIKLFCQSRRPVPTVSMSWWQRAKSCLSSFTSACRRKKPEPTASLPGKPAVSFSSVLIQVSPTSTPNSTPFNSPSP